MRNVLLLSLALVAGCVSSIAFAQPTAAPTFSVLENSAEVSTVQVTYLEAKSAELVTVGDSVMILAEELSPTRQYGVIVKVVDQPVESIEVQQLIEINGLTFAVWPAVKIPPLDGKPGQYLIQGKPGERYGAAIRSTDEPVFLEIQIDGEPEPPEPPKPEPGQGPSEADLSAIKKMSSAAVRSLNDPVTAAAIRSKLSDVIPALSLQLDQATKQVQQSIAQGLLDADVNPPYKDWRALFRVPLDAEIVKLETAGKVTETAHLAVIVGAIIDGLGSTSTTAKSGVIKMYTRDGCSVCELWKSEVWPQIQLRGWKLETIYSSTMTVPTFSVCDGGKCSPNFVGYMSVAQFTTLLGSIR